MCCFFCCCCCCCCHHILISRWLSKHRQAFELQYDDAALPHERSCPKAASYCASSPRGASCLRLALGSAGGNTRRDHSVGSRRNDVIENTVPVGQKEATWWSSARKLTSHNRWQHPASHHHRATRNRASLTPTDDPKTYAHKHTHDVNTHTHTRSKWAYTVIGALDATSLGSFQQAHPGGLHQPHWSFSVLSHCPPPLLLLLQLTAPLWSLVPRRSRWAQRWSPLHLGCGCSRHLWVNG